MLVLNVATCDLEDVLEQGAFRFRASTLTQRLGASVIGATVYDVQPGDKRGPYHYHHGVEEWMYVISGTPVHRDPSGEQTLAPGELVAFAGGPSGAHTLHGPGRVVMFSAGASGWGEAFVTVYPDSDKIAAAPGVMFRRGDALEAWRGEARQTGAGLGPMWDPAVAAPSPRVDVVAMDVEAAAASTSLKDLHARCARLGSELHAQTWDATLFELAPGDTTAPYHYDWCRERWLLTLAGKLTLRHADGESVLEHGSIACFPQGPAGAHQLNNHSDDLVRLIIFSAPVGRPMSTFYPEQGTVLIHISEEEGFLFDSRDEIADYWDGEPGATQ